MRRGYSPSKSRQAEDYSYYNDRTSPIVNERIVRPSDDWKSFCHYNNAVYMGDMLSSQKHGKGLLLHDDGATVVTQYQHDTPSGHNIIFRENSITSILFRTTLDYDIAYKVGKYIIKIPFSDSSHRANGQGCLIDYDTNKIYQLIFQDGAIVQKVLKLERRNNEDVFRKNSITRTIGVKHEQAFELTFQRPVNMHVKYDHNQLTIGYYNDRGDLHGLAAKIYAQNLEVNGQRSLSLKIIERGYYRNSELETYGQKYFSNGNRYIGQFEEGQFQGHGILLCPQEMKWVYGIFANGKLSQVIDSNNERHTRNDFEMWLDSLWRIHQRYNERWIDLNIELPDELYLYRILQEALKVEVTYVDPDREVSVKQGKERLNKIQHQFIEGYPGNVERSYVDQELDRHYSNGYNEYEYGPRTQIYTPKGKDKRKLQQRPIVQERPLEVSRNYRTEDPFNTWYKTNYKTRPLEDYYPNEKYSSRYINYTPRRRPRFYDDLSGRYNDYEPVDSIFRHTYLDSLERQRNNLKKLEREDKDYLNNLRDELAKSPVHRNYYSTPPKYDSDRYKDKPINKKYFNYKDPHAGYVHRWPQNIGSSRDPISYDTYDKYEETPPRPSRNLPYRSPVKDERENYDNRSFVENNYKYWR